MEKFIKIYDDLIPLYIQDYLEFLLTQKSGFNWCFMGNLTGDKNSNNEEGFGITFRKKQDRSLLEPSSLITTHYDALISPLHIFCNTQKFIINHIDFARTYFQLPSINPKTQYPHIDQKFPHWVFLYYVNDSDGDTIFYNDDKEEIKRVSPKKGRIAFFDGLIPHSGSSPSKTKRAIININFHYQDLSNYNI